MSTEHEMEELEEAAESGREHSRLAHVSLTMSILAVLVAVAALLSHRSHTEEVLLQDQATDTWNYYQAKNIRRHTTEQFDAMMKIMQSRDAKDPKTAAEAKATEELIKKNEAWAEKTKTEQEEVKKEAEKLQAEVKLQGRRANHYDLGETLLEVGLVICSITLLTKKQHYWIAGVVSGAAGVVATILGLLVK